MSNSTVRMFLVDNNAVSGIGFQRRKSKTFRNNALIPREVLYESRGAPDYGNFSHQEFPTSIRVLEILKEILKTVKPGDLELIDLFHNEGGADPLIVACALAKIEETEQSLFAPEWVIVTNDKAVVDLALEFNVPTMKVDEFKELIDSSEDDYSTNV